MIGKLEIGTGRSKSRILTSLFGAVAASAISPAVAQTQQSAADTDTRLEEIVVTATKRGALAVQDVPASINAFSAEMLDDLGITDVDQLSFQVPGFTVIDNGPSESRLVVRGIQSEGQPQVGLYFDEAAPPPNQGSTSNSGQFTADFELVDLERVEVLKGPQSTSFGVNSQTGVVRVITQKPKADLVEAAVHAKFSGTRFGEANWQVDGMVNIPVVRDKFAVRVAAYALDESGFIDNVRLANSKDRDDLNYNETEGVRIRTRFTPTENITWDAMAWFQNRDLGGDFNFFPEVGFLQTNNFTRENKEDDMEMYNTTLNIDTDFAHITLTGMKFERDFGNRFDSTFIIDLLGVEVPEPEQFPGGILPELAPAQTDQSQTVDSTMFEGRLNSTHPGPIEWLLGGFWRKRISDFQSFVPIADPETGEPLNLPPTNVVINPVAGVDGIPGCSPCVFARESETEIREKAIFGEVSYDFEDDFGLPINLLFGLRWFENSIDNFGREVFPFALFGSVPGGEDTPVFAEEDQLIKKVNLSWRLSDDDLAYFTWSQGFRLGGTNQAGIVAIPEQFESDQVDSWEVGFKTQGWDRRITTNIAGFLMSWDNLQTAGQDPTGAFGFIGNAGQARVLGLEGDITVNPLEGLTFRGGVTWLPDRELTEDQITDDVIAPGRDGDLIPQVPEWQGNVFARYSRPLPGDWSILNGFVHFDASYLGDRTTDFRPDNPNFRILESFWLANGSVGIGSDGLGAEVRIFANNIFDKLAQFNLETSAEAPDQLVPARPRTVGVEVRASF